MLGKQNELKLLLRWIFVYTMRENLLRKINYIALSLGYYIRDGYISIHVIPRSEVKSNVYFKNLIDI